MSPVRQQLYSGYDYKYSTIELYTIDNINYLYYLIVLNTTVHIYLQYIIYTYYLTFIARDS